MAMTNSVHGSPSSSVRSVDRVFEDAQSSGELHLNCRKLKEYPIVSCKYDLSDVVYADLSKNRLSEIPEQICNCGLLEQLDCYHNVIRFIPDAIINLQTLTFLDLSRNQLTYIPVALCNLPLQICILRNNRLVSIPEEISCMKCIRVLDVSCNEIAILPPQIGSLHTLQDLNLRRNLLVELPIEMCQLKLMSLDVSGNRLSSLPTPLRLMATLQDLSLDHNPLTFPPAVVCRRGRIHVFKFLEIQAIKEDKQGIILENEFKKFRSQSLLSDARFQNGFASGSCRKSYTFDSGYSTSDCDSKSVESQEFACGFKRYSTESQSVWDTANMAARNQNSSPASSSTDSKIAEESPSGTKYDPKSLLNMQPYREYKEALRQQRASKFGNVYKRPSAGDESSMSDQGAIVSSPRSETSLSVKYVTTSALPNSVEVELKKKHHSLVSQQHVLPPTELRLESRLKENSSTVPKINCVNSDKSMSSSVIDENLNGRLNLTWPKNSPTAKPVKSSFTMKREFDKAREEQQLISDLRETLETRLKLKLPEEIEPALYDGVFLCHLANQVHPNSVACIHVPSPAVPKLTVAKCRRNVDNFLEACRRLGVPNAELQRREDVMTMILEKQYQAKVAFHYSPCPICTKENNTTPRRSAFQEFLLSLFLLMAFVFTCFILCKFPEPEDELF